MRIIAITVSVVVASALVAAPAIADRATRGERRHQNTQRRADVRASQPRRPPRRDHDHRRYHGDKRHHDHKRYYNGGYRYRPYYGYGYGYRYGYWPGYSLYYFDDYSYRRRHRCDETCTEHGKHGSEFGAGWKLFGDGNNERALSAFSDAAGKDPEDGVARIGVALATAAGGNLERGVWAMRRALRVDAAAARYAPIDDDVAERIDAVAGTYRNLPESALDPKDRAFMLAALYYLVDKKQLALTNVRNAVAAGDDSRSASELELLLRQQVVDVWEGYPARGEARGVR